MTNSNPSPTWSDLLSGRNGLRSLALAGGVALHAINVYIVATVLPSVVDDIGGLQYYAWNMTLFVIASIVGSTLTPVGIDRAGLRNAFLLAIGIFSIGTAICASAPTMFWMLGGRTAQGLGGGLLLGLSYSAARILFAEPLWPKAMALLSSMWGAATLAGPAIGGIFAELNAWRYAFWSVIVVALALAALVYTQIARDATTPSPDGVRVPLKQLAFMVLAVLVVSVGSLSKQLHWNIIGVVGGIALSIVVAQIDLRSQSPLMPQGGYHLKGNLGSMYACMALLSIAMTAEIFIPYFLQVIQGYSPMIAGYFMVLMSAGWSTGSISSASRQIGTTNRLMQAGPAVSAISLAALALTMSLYLPAHVLALAFVLGVFLFGVGLGIGITWPHLLTELFRRSPEGQENIASSAIITVQLYSLAFGAALGGIVTNSAGFTDPGGLIGSQSATRALLLVLALAPALGFFLIRPVVKQRQTTT